MISIPIARGTLINIAAFVSDLDKEGSNHDEDPNNRFTGGLLDLYSDFEEDVQQLLRVIVIQSFIAE